MWSSKTERKLPSQRAMVVLAKFVYYPHELIRIANDFLLRSACRDSNFDLVLKIESMRLYRDTRLLI